MRHAAGRLMLWVVSIVVGVLLLLLVLPFPCPEAELYLNEYLPSNRAGILDRDGDTSDWIEIYNSGPDDVDLFEFGLSDDDEAPLKWQFPRWTLGAAEHLLVFASDKNRMGPLAHWDTVVSWGDSWRYRINLSAPPDSWWEEEFDDSGWPEGPSGFGYGDGDDATVLPPCMSVSLRKTLVVSDTTHITQLCFHIDYDDAFIVYLNGDELFRRWLDYAGHPPWDLPATYAHEAQIYQGGIPTSFLIDDVAGLLHPGENTLAIQVHNESLESDDLTMIPIMSIGRSQSTGGSGPDEFVRFLLPHLHTNFKLDRQGETLLLSSPGGLALDGTVTDSLPPDISKGRYPDGAATWHYYAEPSPEASNGPGGIDFAAAPQFTPEAGFYASPPWVTLSSETSPSIIRYTLDGAEPTESSILYSSPIPVDTTTVIRARAYAPGFLPSHIATRSFVVGEPTDLPVFSLTTDPPNLWDEEYGIYVLGNNASPHYPYYGANYWMDWERPLHVEYFEANGTPTVCQEMAVKIHGGFTRTYAQKALRIIADEDYGPSELPYRFFADKAIASFKRLILRNAGNDWCLAHLRDGLQQRLAGPTGVGYQAFAPARVYLNGAYWGIHNTRERIDARYLADNYGADPDAVDLLRDQNVVVEGTAAHYLAMLDYIETHGLGENNHFDYVATQMDVANYGTYYLTRIFFANTDWPCGNVRYWRPAISGGRWRWILQDMDWGLGINVGQWHNTLEFALDPSGPEWPNPPWSTFLMRNLLENEAYRYEFINRYADHLNSTFRPDVTLPVAEAMMADIASEIPEHMTRWGFDPAVWDQETAEVLTFLQERPAIARQHLREYFGLTGTYELSLDITPSGAGAICLTALRIEDTWSGTYFLGAPMELKAVPEAGYAFSGWSDPTLPDQPDITIDPQGHFALTAHFEIAAGASDAIVLNEINYHSRDNVDVGDWVELYNRGDVTMDVSDWLFKDEEDDHCFSIPRRTTLAPGDFIVLCQDTSSLRARFPNCERMFGDFDFGLSNGGECLRLFDTAGDLRDSLTYDDEPPWPPEPDGTGPTLELISPQLDNADPQAWAASMGYGTPGTVNSAMTMSVFDPEGDSPLPGRGLRLAQPVPTPGTAMPVIRLLLDRPRRVQVGIYDVTGRLVQDLADAVFEAGEHEFRWSELAPGGPPLSPGIYFVHMRCEGYAATRKLVLVK